jgi:hypothetical protein
MFHSMKAVPVSVGWRISVLADSIACISIASR